MSEHSVETDALAELIQSKAALTKEDCLTLAQSILAAGYTRLP